MNKCVSTSLRGIMHYEPQDADGSNLDFAESKPLPCMGVWANIVLYWHGTLSGHSKPEIVSSATRYFANFCSFSPTLHRYA
jgi:hypothetical protein